MILRLFFGLFQVFFEKSGLARQGDHFGLNHARGRDKKGLEGETAIADFFRVKKVLTVVC